MINTLFQQFITDLLNYSLTETRNPLHYAPQQRQQYRLKNNLISNSFIIYGPSASGKTSSILWAASFDPTIVVIIIDCQIDSTQVQFVKSLYNGVMNKCDHTNQELQELSRNRKNNINSPIFENMKFDELNEFIKQSGNKFLIVLKKCQKIAQMKKPTLFYNLLEWINGPMKPYLGLAFLSRAFHFTDRLQKRVKSRLTAKSVTLMRPQGQKIIKIYVKRFSSLEDYYKQMIKNQKSSHRKSQNSNELIIKLRWTEKIIHTIQKSKQFKQLVNESINSINNQFITCMKIGILKSLNVQMLQLSQNKFDIELVKILRDASSHIAPNYYRNLVLQCPLYTILVLSLICYMGINNRLPYRIITIFDIYKQKVLNSTKFNHISSLGSSKILFEKALNQLIDMRIIVIKGQNDDNQCVGKENNRISQCSDKQIILSIPAQDLQQVISQMEQLPQTIKDIIRPGSM